ncbi:MAG: hypothetical protein K2M89_04155 [Clostridiales bacterium]|nr:hypothetical protein [Clostridiales bacterium]
MYNSDNGRRSIAKSIAHYAYRNTKLEDYHAACVRMDKNFYRVMCGIVSKKLNIVRIFQRYLDEFPKDFISEKTAFDELIKTVPEDLQLRFIRYCQNIVYGFAFGSNWDTAQRIDGIKEKQSYANYVLGGKFLEYCNAGYVLDDKAMCIINKDVYNRIYTLLVDETFNR